MHHNKLKILKEEISIHRLPVNAVIPSKVYESGFYAIIKTDDEVSIVCDSSIRVTSEESNAGWSCIQVIGPLDFSLTGVLSGISTVLANSKINIFALSTFNTDYILVEKSNILKANQALLESGYTFEE